MPISVGTERRPNSWRLLSNVLGNAGWYSPESSWLSVPLAPPKERLDTEATKLQAEIWLTQAQGISLQSHISF